ncbi:NAD(P)/FAD-dependent oxidoreductase [Magnetovibrio blakemorei]|uniref:Sulfide-quinone reductase n=1 Tax=Magnetovibrio blakemorei TaxID=28181 RepID=A0A1E5Q9Y9_9PROT|nr:FAD-dependent oxidoreductase [Magnetovibrio blakemorei]OEJ68539.1 pyridine nucleotide-disulfide oxidoreductase [Magnetovibrio blakemorei]
MTHIVVLGAGIGGIPMAYEMKENLKNGEKITVISNTDTFHFVPSNPWVAVNWRSRKDICIEMPKVFKKKGIDFISSGAKKVHPDKNQVELNDGTSVDYDFLIIATGPELAFDEVPGLGPDGHTHSVCHVDHAVAAGQAYEKFLENPGPIVIGAAAGASCFGPALEMALIIETDMRKRKIRDKVKMTYVSPEPYVGHLGLGGVGDTKGMVESIMRERHINWICNAKVTKAEDGMIYATEHDSNGAPIKEHELPNAWSMILPAFRGIDAVKGIAGLGNPRDFIIVDKNQRNPTFKNIFSVGVCIAIPPVEVTPVPTGCPKTGFMIESMVTATAHNIRDIIDGKEPSHVGTWSAACLADFGDGGAAFVAVPQIPPRNINWSSEGKWVHLAKIAFEKYFLRKIRKGISEPGYEKHMLKLAGLSRLKKG